MFKQLFKFFYKIKNKYNKNKDDNIKKNNSNTHITPFPFLNADLHLKKNGK